MVRRIQCAVLLACFVVGMSGSTAHALNSFTANFSEKELKLKNPTDADWEAWFQKDIGYQRMVERNSPFVELINDATSTSPITQFHLTIGDNRFNFTQVQGADFVSLGRTTPGFTLNSSLTDSGDGLTVNIGGGGLQPGQQLRFKIKLGIDASYASTYAASFGSSVPDYRTVLFDMNGFNVYDNTTDKDDEDNAKAYVVFTPGGQSETVAFPDEDVPVSQFYNNHLRGGCCCVGDPVQIFQLEGGQVPEPGSFALAMLGVAGFLMKSRNRSRRMAA